MNKSNIKSPAMSTPIKDPIPNQYINILIAKQDSSLPPNKAKYSPGFKPLFNVAHDPNSTEDYPNDSIDNSCNEKEDSVNKLKVPDNKDIDDKYKNDHSRALNSN